MIAFCAPIPRIPSPALQWGGEEKACGAEAGELTREFFFTHPSARGPHPLRLLCTPSPTCGEGQGLGATDT